MAYQFVIYEYQQEYIIKYITDTITSESKNDLKKDFFVLLLLIPVIRLYMIFIKNINGIKAQINNTTYLVYLIILNISFKTSNLVQSKSIYINPPLKKKCENKFTH